MADSWHVKWLSEGVVRWNRRRKKVSFVPDLSGLTFFDLLPPDFRDEPKTSRYFEGIDFSEADLSNSDLSGMNFANGKFEDANLSGSDLSLSNFSGAKFRRANLEGVKVDNALFRNAIFEEAKLVEVDFHESDVSGAVFIASDLEKWQLTDLGDERVSVFASRANFETASADKMLQIKVADQRQGVEKDHHRTRKNCYDVFYGTNRNAVYERGALVDFGGSSSSELSYGVCEVIVPEGHKIGSIGSPLWRRLFNKNDDRLAIRYNIALNQTLFFEHLRAAAEKMRVREKPTIFVHGYNNSFEDAVLRAAQIGYDLGLGQGIGLFSWPSKGQFLKYSADEASVDASKYHLADFLEQFVGNIEEGSVNVIAHSMGCRCLLGAFEVLADGRKRVLKSVNQVILAAADVDTAIMPRQGLHATKYSTRTTSYVSDKDKALTVSGWLHNFPRVGITPPTYVMSGMDTVVVNDLDLGNFSHGYVGTSRSTLNDIFSLLKRNDPPERRYSLELASEAGHEFWRIRE
ncbi:alpha/beta hydrolase [Phaeobacter inhibens]|uniref:alpha/beta hydrolase n=1 Tax=Phaeobacter inhibens TaxID=221822 RepID=UPI0021A3234B|nr:alpha/beta hydrolase [Phaeobacter inhibens]UWR60260.1 alpha/beta hydrolase [Phaeobacter inhibens]UWR88695.1 alpha/beta hydrolase [Phaeobacter inhibens]UWR91973.1 alpha/beta hydrolase [Phaeobacter inhibens]